MSKEKDKNKALGNETARVPKEVRVRFAPSPTGLLHIGGARTALYNFLFAKAFKGTFILRIEDTDLARSKKVYEKDMINDLHWLGLDYHEGPDCPGEFGPYRQSERREIYRDISERFIAEGLAYYCFLSSDELLELTAAAEEEKKAPHTYHNKYRDYDLQAARKKVAAGEKYVIRFKNPGLEWKLKDKVRGKVKFPPDMVGDFVIMRSNGMPTFNFCCAVDDHLMKITHVIRAEEHLNNTVRQLMIYKALKARPPEFCHVSLLVGADRQKLSKRHGATSVHQYREQKYLPEALMNYLCLLGWSHPREKDFFSLDDIIPLFDLKRFNKASAFYDIKKLDHYNARYLQKRPDDFFITEFNKDEKFKVLEDEWKLKFVELFKGKLHSLNDLKDKMDEVFSEDNENGDDVREILQLPSTVAMKKYLAVELDKYATQESLSADTVGMWMQYLKENLKIVGKPLFMGMRVLLTGRCHGPDLTGLLVLTPLSIILKRFQKH